jgi:hypothetical protein
MLAVLIVFARTVCQSPVPVVSGNSVILEVLAVTLAEGCCCAWAVPIASDIAKLKAATLRMS